MVSNQKTKIAVVSVGNFIAGDDGLGYCVVEEMKTHTISSDVEFAHGGVAGLTVFEDLVGKGYDVVYFIDAVYGLETVGEMVKLTLDELLEKVKQSDKALSLHQNDFTFYLRLALAIKLDLPKEIIFIGVQVGQMEIGRGLTEEINVHDIAQAIIHEIDDSYGL